MYTIKAIFIVALLFGLLLISPFIIFIGGTLFIVWCVRELLRNGKEMDDGQRINYEGFVGGECFSEEPDNFTGAHNHKSGRPK